MDETEKIGSSMNDNLNKLDTSGVVEEKWSKRMRTPIISDEEKELLLRAEENIKKDERKKQYFEALRWVLAHQRETRYLRNKNKINQKEEHQLDTIVDQLFNLIKKNDERKLKSVDLEEITNLAIRLEELKYQEALAEVKTFDQLKETINLFGKIESSNGTLDEEKLIKIIELVEIKGELSGYETRTLGFREVVERVLRNKTRRG